MRSCPHHPYIERATTLSDNNMFSTELEYIMKRGFLLTGTMCVQMCELVERNVHDSTKKNKKKTLVCSLHMDSCRVHIVILTAETNAPSHVPWNQTV